MAANLEQHCFYDTRVKNYATVISLPFSLGEQISTVSCITNFNIISVPHLEHTDNVLLVHFVQTIQNSLKIHTDAIFTWGDTVALLSWIQSEPAVGKPSW